MAGEQPVRAMGGKVKKQLDFRDRKGLDLDQRSYLRV